MKNEQQIQNLLLKVDPRPTFRNNFLQPATNVFVAGQVDHARWKMGNIDENLQRNNVARQVEGFCISYFATLSKNFHVRIRSTKEKRTRKIFVSDTRKREFWRVDYVSTKDFPVQRVLCM